eukprot:GHVR01005880.1.p1 GENE.GHVR01005880.1~~GHVR01005880.1.p1  ORF type:complete len:143 (+),score=6.11 GHVR01005880.1:219-647(+)
MCEYLYVHIYIGVIERIHTTLSVVVHRIHAHIVFNIYVFMCEYLCVCKNRTNYLPYIVRLPRTDIHHLSGPPIRGHIDAVEQLTDMGAIVNVKNDEGKTALMKASESNHLNAVECLIEKGAEKKILLVQHLQHLVVVSSSCC